jgi:acetyl/propionyl-CoA carboxylase alpha subunit/acetyl-CoA carboxylase carboxyltransferase component
VGQFKRVAIINRGECAMRLIRALKELNSAGQAGFCTIALYTDSDARALFVREADEAWSLGSATFIDDRDGSRKSRYLDYRTLEQTLIESRAEAVWVGWGFVAEQAEFAELCRKLGLVFIGPQPEVTRKLGDKIASKLLAQEAGVPVAPWSGGAVHTLQEAEQQARALGFPLMIKATAGGGGRGIRRVASYADLADAFESARSEALKSFGDETLFMETLLQGVRHVEVQIIGDNKGTVWALGVRDCSIQRRNQKVMEESPSSLLSAEQEQALCEAARRLAQLAGYCNAGTVEFLYDPASAGFYFMEVNARLQAEHPVTEATRGVDLVKLQLHVAMGGELVGPEPASRGHAIEVRVNAEDPERAFAPAPGEIVLFQQPGGPGIRIDTGFVEGDRVAPEFDSMLAKVIASGSNREEAMARLGRALREMRLALRGGTSNKGFLIGLLERPEVRNSEYDIGWLDRLAMEDQHISGEHADVAILHAAMESYRAEVQIEQAQFFAVAARGRLRLRQEVGYELELSYRGASYRCLVLRTGPQQYRASVDGIKLDFTAEQVGRFEYVLYINDRQFQILSLPDGNDYTVEVNGIPHHVSREAAGLVRAPAPGVLLSHDVEIGQQISKGQRLVTLEAMKTEVPVLAPCDGTVGELLVGINVQVDAGSSLLRVEPLATGEQNNAAPRVSLQALSGGDSAPQLSGAVRFRQSLEEMKRLLLGFDVEPAATDRFVASHHGMCSGTACTDTDVLRDEDEILNIFADVCALFSHRGEGTQLNEEEVRTPEEYLLLYLRSLDAGAAGVSVSFVESLQRSLAHYGVDSLKRTPELEECLLWISKAHQNMTTQVKVVLSILERRLEEVEQLAAVTGEDFRLLLDRIVPVTRRHYPAVSDLAREVRYRYFYRPFFNDIWQQAYARADSQLNELVGASSNGERNTLIEQLLDFPHPLLGLLARRFNDAGQDARELMTEILARRQYRVRTLRELSSCSMEEFSCTRGEYEHEGERVQMLTVIAPYRRLSACIESIQPLLEQLPDDPRLVIDFYLIDTGELQAPDLREQLGAALAQAGFCRPVHRIVFALTNSGSDGLLGATEHLTFRLREAEYVEDDLHPGLHPMMAKRLEIWRLGNFGIKRLPSPEGVYLFHGVAQSNPKDERLFAFAEVRDLTPIYDEKGNISRLPYLEMMLMESLAAIRLFQSHRAKRSRLQWNRVFLHVWPPIEFGAEEMNLLAQLLTPAIEGLGLEKVLIRGRLRDREGTLRDTVIQAQTPGGREVVLSYRQPSVEPLQPLSEYTRNVVKMRQRGMIYPYEVIRTLAPMADETQNEYPPGSFIEYDLDDNNKLVDVDRPPGKNSSGIIVGLITNYTSKYPEGMTRVLMMGDASHGMGSLSEPECRRLLAALDMAEAKSLPVDWFALSAGALIAMDSGTENLEWIALVIRRLVEFTQVGGEVNVVVYGVNVGAQSYWNAEATMLMHTRGILVMTTEGSMLLTGKRALDYSGVVSAEDNQGIGGYEKIMGVNGQAQYWAADVWDACHILLRHYEHTYVLPGERFPRRGVSADPVDRDVCAMPHGYQEGYGFDTVGDIFSDGSNPGRNKPFDIRKVMQAVIDQDLPPLERWHDMREAESAVVWDAHLGGYPVALLAIESHPITRLGFVPTDGPERWSSGTLFPLSSKKIARAINAASNNRPVVVLANLSGFDGSPESMRRLQLEYGAEIARAVVNFRGPMVFCGICRYHGGAYVVFSHSLNDGLEVAALEGSFASVIGGKPAAAVVFSSEVDRRTRADARLQDLEGEITTAEEPARGRLRTRWHEVYETVHSEKLGEVAQEFDNIHSVHRAQKVGSLHHVVPPSRLRPYLIEALERGIQREIEAGPPAR